ncbi:MAG: phosphatase PAP2 family protein, partial [Sphingomonadales bacterium]
RRILSVFLAIAIVLLVFSKLATEVREGETLGFDRWLLLDLRNPSDPDIPLGPRWLLKAMLDLTALGGVSVLALITILAAGYLIAARKRASAAFLVGAIAGGAVVSTLLKTIFARPRPELVAHLVAVDSMSFPSGHAMNSAVTYLTLGAALARAETDRRVRIFIMVAAVGLTLTIGFSRVYLGVHWPSDVIAGWAVGGAWAMLCSLVGQYLQSKRRIEPPGEEAELPFGD